MYTYIYIYLFLHIHVHIFIYIYIYIYTYTFTCTYICIYINICMCIYKYIYNNCMHTCTTLVSSDMPPAGLLGSKKQDMVLIPRSALSGDIWLPVRLGDEVGPQVLVGNPLFFFKTMGKTHVLLGSFG